MSSTMREAEMKVLERVTPSPLVRGHGKIELFDAHSLRKVAEVPFENAIHNLQLAHAKWRVHTAFSDYPPNSPTNSTWQVSNGLQQNNSDPEPLYAMRDLICWEDASAVTVSDEIIRGRIIAWSAKDFYVGSDTRRGGINQVETLFRSDYVRWVADWPTSSGNGTFASVGWGYTDEPTSPTWPSQPGKVLSSGLVATYNEALYPGSTRQGGSRQSSYSPTNELWVLSNNSTMWRAGTATPLWVAPNSIQDTCWGSTALFGTAYSSTNALNSSYCALYQLNPSTGAVVATTSFPQFSPSSSGQTPYRICMIDDTTMYVLYRNDWRIYKFTLTGSIWGSPVLIPAPANGQQTWQISRFSNGDLLTNDQGGGFVTRWNPVDGSVRWQAFGVDSSNNGWNFAAKRDGTDGYTFTGGQSNISDYTIRFVTRIPYGLGTRVLLPTAVTKSNLQTMKITYEFDFS